MTTYNAIAKAPDSAALFPAVEKTYNEVSAAAHEFVFDTMFNYVREKLSTVPTLEVWKRQPPSGIMLEAQFSLSPSVRSRPHAIFNDYKLIVFSYINTNRLILK